MLAGTEGRIVDLTTVSGDGEVADDLLDALEQALVNHGAHTVASLVAPGELRTRLEGRGYGPADGAVYLQRALPRSAAVPETLARLGARTIGPGLCRSGG